MAGMVAAVAASAQATWQPAFLTPSENDALVALGERIIPGSAVAQCNRVIDLILNIESSQTQSGFRQALKPFIDAEFEQKTSSEQDALLTSASAPNHPLAHSFVYLKEWLADAYWTSKAGAKELGYDGQMAWPDFNLCPHPEVPSA